jgi:23S rRNA (cytidine1920-2'-O)/16S rRNA (cytidine1409-2'-O)-methyltransferase
MTRKVKHRFDEVLVLRGVAESVRQAQAIILAGEVVIEGYPEATAGSRVEPDVRLIRKEKNPYVSRGGLKLKAALDGLAIDVAGKVCMDIGASTGGFTDCLLQRGAAAVYAVDVGKGLLDPKLRLDARVRVFEGVNFRNFPCDCLKDPIQFATIDVSFISLEKILPPTVQCLVDGGEILALVKPQFEALPSEAIKGVVRDETVRCRTIEAIKSFALSGGLALRGEIDSAVKGPQGNIEHFLWLTCPAASPWHRRRP